MAATRTRAGVGVGVPAGRTVASGWAATWVGLGAAATDDVGRIVTGAAAVVGVVGADPTRELDAWVGGTDVAAGEVDVTTATGATTGSTAGRGVEVGAAATDGTEPEVSPTLAERLIPSATTAQPPTAVAARRDDRTRPTDM
jgi:hypothetical protein